jgi:hypothetical protein
MLRPVAHDIQLTVACGSRTIECAYRAAQASWWIRTPDSGWQTAASVDDDRVLFDALELGLVPTRESRLVIGPHPFTGSISNNTYPPEAWFWTVESPAIGSASGVRTSLHEALWGVLEDVVD